MHPGRRRSLLQLGAWGASGAWGTLGVAGCAAAPRALHAQTTGAVLTTASAHPPPSTQAQATDVWPGRVLRFPDDHGAHLGSRTEWWYATGWMGTEAAPTHGFQITFFRSRTDLAANNTSRFAARHLLFAHAAVTALAPAAHGHSQRLVRWNGSPDAATGHAAVGRGAVQMDGPHARGWHMHDDGQAWRVQAEGDGLAINVVLTRTQPLLLQGDAGFSRKGPDVRHASHYYSEPQLAVSGSLRLAGREVRSQGRAWMDHEWSEAILTDGAVGWDWIGMNLFDGSALTAFELRRVDGSAVWAGGSYRTAGAMGAPARIFAADEVRFTAGRRWRSPATAASYPVEWQVQCPGGMFRVRALADAQELDSRATSGTVYWEGLSELLDPQGRRVGLGYLEMTGYAGALKL